MPARTVPFTKASACGNDFLIIDSKHLPPDPAEFTRRICDRHHGVGADGVEWISVVPEANVEARLLNADGSSAEISGNGTRCVAAYWHNRMAPEQEVIRVLTGAGVKECTCVSHSGGHFEFEMKIGTPRVEDYLDLQLASGPVRGQKIWMGNPQFVVFVEDFNFPWQARGAEIQAQPDFPAGVNVDFVKVTGPHAVESRFFERGAGETMSSGTGSCASALSAMVTHGVMHPVTVTAPGGSQVVRWDKEVFLQGPARLICDGDFFV